MANNKDNRKSDDFLTFREYVNIAYSHGFNSLEAIAEQLKLGAQVARNLSSGRTPTSDERGHHFFLDAKFRGWV